MKILHICNDFSYSKVYRNLYIELDKLEIEQVIYHPLRTRENLGKNSFEFSQTRSKLLYSTFILKKYHRIFFRLKVSSLYQDLVKQIDINEIKYSYPTTLFSDGAIAYRLKIKFNIPYVVAVRNTDVNLFMKYRRDLIPLAHKILKSASKIVFISEGLKRIFFSDVSMNKLQKIYSDKVVVIPNGIDDFWINNIQVNNMTKSNNFLFVGRFDKNKNAENLIKALNELRDKYNCSLTLVGGGGNRDVAIKKMIESNSSWINYYGIVNDKESLLSIFRLNKFFVMPSIFETFGLVYIEALSQGLPVLFTENQGIDGLFKEKVGISTKCDYESIRDNLIKLISADNYDIKSIDFEKFRWSKIATIYTNLFKHLQ